MNGGGGAERLRSDNKCLKLDPAASRQWNSIRRAERLATDTDVARLLLSLYRGPGCEDVCLRCSASLPRVCTHCHSHQPLGPSADSENNPLPVRESGTQHNRDNNPLPVRGSGTQHNRDNNVSVARTRSGLMLAPSGPEAKKSKRTSDSVGRRTLQVRLKRCDSLLDANGTASITPQAGSLGRKHNTLLGQEAAPVTKSHVDMHSAVLGDSQSRMSSDVGQDTVCLCVKTEFEFIAKAEQNQSNSFDTHMGQDTKCEIVRQEPASEDKKENWALEGTLQAALFSDIIEPESEEISVPQTPTGNADRLSDSKSYLKQNEALKQSKGPTTTNSSSTSTSTSTSTWKDRRQDSSLTFSIHRTESSIAENTLSSSQEHTEQDTNLKLSEGSGVEVSHAEQDENLTPTEGSGVEVSHAEQDANLTPTEGSGVEVSHAEQDANLTSTEGSGVEVSHAEQDANLTPTEGSGVEVSHTEQDANLTPTEGSGVEVSHAEQDANLEHSKSNGFDVSHRRGRSQRGRSQRGAPVSYADCDSESSSSSWGTGHSDVDTDTDMQSTEDEQSPQQSLLACRPDTSQCEQDQLALSHTGQTDAFQAHHKSAQQHLEKKADMAAPHVTDTDREQHVGNSSVVSSPLRESGTSGQAPVIERVSSALNEVTSPLRESGTSGQAPVIEMMSSALNEVTSPLRESGTSGQAPVIEMMSSALNEVTSTEVHQHIQRTKTLLSAPLSKKGKRGQESAIETMKSTVQKGLHTEEQQPVQYLYDTVTPTSLEEIDDTEQQQPVNEGESQSPLPSLQIAAQDPLECEPQATASSQGCQATDERAGKKRHLQITGFYTSEQEDSQHAAGEETMTSRHGARCEQCGVSCEAEENIDGAKRDVTENTKCQSTLCRLFTVSGDPWDPKVTGLFTVSGDPWDPKVTGLFTVSGDPWDPKVTGLFTVSGDPWDSKVTGLFTVSGDPWDPKVTGLFTVSGDPWDSKVAGLFTVSGDPWDPKVTGLFTVSGDPWDSKVTGLFTVSGDPWDPKVTGLFTVSGDPWNPKVTEKHDYLPDSSRCLETHGIPRSQRNMITYMYACTERGVN
ncbi:uncharacterized protein [Littorina saxatilis]|uniref:uncharacterized protein n=1 Tax=Littorina saxatilis TaxID=31220 RepID=UPI0038B63A71